MSSLSQTLRPRTWGFGARFALSMMAVAAVLGFALNGAWGAVGAAAARAHPHLPDMAVWARLSTPIRIHLLTAFTALALGAALMIVRKGRTFHRIAGWAWVSLVAVTAGATLFVRSLNPGHWSLLHLFTAWVLIALPIGIMWVKRRDVARHRTMMMGLFYGGFAVNVFIAFLPGRALWALLFG